MWLPVKRPTKPFLDWFASGGRSATEGKVPPAVVAQLEKELALIAKLEVAQFFLSVYEIVKIARDKSILCQGRGSAANSAVCFVLGITAVDPARSSLLFERFLSAERNEPPDIDVDFEHERREEVIQAIYEKYGRERVGHGLRGHLLPGQERAARDGQGLRPLARAGRSPHASWSATTILSMPISARLQRGRLRPQGQAHPARVEGGCRDPGFPRHMSMHVGGFVLSASSLDEVSPVEPAKMPGRTVVPWDKDDIDALGFFKVDVLGLGMLTAIRKALELIHRSAGNERRRASIPSRPWPRFPPKIPSSTTPSARPTPSASSRSRAARRWRCCRA